MSDPISPAHARMRHRPLAACLAAVLCVSAPVSALAATTWTVDTCDEASVGSGTTGSLRYAAANAVSGDTIDMTALTCGTITLSSGAVGFAQTDITVKGPGKDALTINGSDDRVLTHSGSGTFAVNDLTVRDGYLHPPFGTQAYGGCIESRGNVYLNHVGVHSCRAVAHGAEGAGGGVYGRDLVLAKYSEISGNAVSATNGGIGLGGGIASHKDVVIASSTISGNHSIGTGGGINVRRGNLIVVGSTISGNTALHAGGIYQVDFDFSNASNALSFTLHNSTVSGNSANGHTGGVWTNAGTIEVKNSTVAFNTAGYADTNYGIFSPGFAVSDTGVDFSDPANPKVKVITLQSSVFSNNAYGTPATIANDFDTVHFAQGLPPGANSTPISGQNNLVFATQLSGLQNTMTTGACPGLGPLRDNGGPTQTHALAWGSPAIDQGNNTVPFAFDQRGAPFARVSGAAADIGAYEVQQADIVFVNGFDGPPTCPG